MTKKIIFLPLLLASILCNAQTNPAITSWMQNTTIFGSYYQEGNFTPIPLTLEANCQVVSYSADWVYVETKGIPTYPTGIFTGDGNTNVAGDQDAIYKFPLNPTENTGTPTATNAGNIGVFINGVSLFDYRDGVAWNNNTQTICGGPPPNAMCPGPPGSTQAWNRDAIPAEKLGFDCAKGHPAGTNYHHHQNPSAFKFDSQTSISYSAICDLYDSDGLYTIDASEHSPLIGFAYDGFPIYGAYAYANTNGTGGITRMKSSYQLRNQTTRTNGPSVGQVVGTQTFFNGYFREDYEYIEHPGQADYLDEHNGRICITPEYPNGIYCYFTTVNADNSSAYPYAVGPTFYGNKTAAKVTSISEATTIYQPTTSAGSNTTISDIKVNVFPNPSNEFIAIQVVGLNKENLTVELLDLTGRLLQTSSINAGATNAYLDTRTVYSGNYLVKISGVNSSTTQKVVITK